MGQGRDTLSEMVSYSLVLLILYAIIQVRPTDGQLYWIEMDDGAQYISEMEDMPQEELDSVTNKFSIDDDGAIELGINRDDNELVNALGDAELNSEATKDFRKGDLEGSNNLDIKHEETDYQIIEKKLTPPPHPLPDQDWDEPWLAIEDKE